MSTTADLHIQPGENGMTGLPSHESPPVLDIHDVTVAYHHKPVLWNIDLTISEPRLVSIVGPNGAGKSTLIKAILGLVPMASGKVSIFGKPVSQSLLS